MAALLVLLVLAYGAVHPPARALYLVAATALLLWQVLLRFRSRRRVAPRDPAVILSLLGLAWVGFALVPLPAGLLSLLAPHTWELAVGAPLRAGLPAPAWHPIAVDPGAAAAGLGTAAAHLCLFVIAAATFSGRAGARLLAGVIALAGGGVAVLAIIQQLVGAHRIYFVGLERPAFYGTFVNANHTAAFLAVACFCGLGRILRERELGRRAAFGLSALLSAVGVLYSLSRGGILTLVIGLAVFVGGAAATQGALPRRAAGGDEVGRFFRRHALLLMLLGLGVFYLSLPGPARIGRKLATVASLDLPTDYRSRVWRDSMGAIADWPLSGSGAGSFGEVFPAYRTFVADVRTEMAESDWIQLTVECGLVELFLVAALAGAVMGRFGYRYLVDPLRFSGAHLGFGISLLTLALHSLVDFPLRLPAMGALAATLAGALVGALHRLRPVVHLHRDAPSARALLPRAIAWSLLAPLTWSTLPAVLSREDHPADREGALEALARHPADALAWFRVARFEEGATASRAYQRALHLDPTNTALAHLAGGKLVEVGDPQEAVQALQHAIGLYERSGPHQDSTLLELRLELAEAHLWAGDLDAAASTLEAAGPQAGARAALLRADLQAAREPDPGAPTRAIVDGYLATAALAAEAKDGVTEGTARKRALVLTADASRSLEPAEARHWFDRLLPGTDPGELLQRMETLSASGSLDATRIWGGSPSLILEAPEEGRTRLSRPPGAPEPGAVLTHRVEGGTERLELSYPGAAVVTDVWTAPLALRTADPALVLEIPVKTTGPLGNQGCAVVDGSRLFGEVGPPDSGGWRTIAVRGIVSHMQTVSLQGWCFDTRGRPGPYWIGALTLRREPPVNRSEPQ